MYYKLLQRLHAALPVRIDTDYRVLIHEDFIRPDLIWTPLMTNSPSPYWRGVIWREVCATCIDITCCQEFVSALESALKRDGCYG